MADLNKAGDEVHKRTCYPPSQRWWRMIKRDVFIYVNNSPPNPRKGEFLWPTAQSKIADDKPFPPVWFHDHIFFLSIPSLHAFRLDIHVLAFWFISVFVVSLLFFCNFFIFPFVFSGLLSPRSEVVWSSRGELCSWCPFLVDEICSILDNASLASTTSWW